MKNQEFPFPMKKSEALIGWIYLPVHIFALVILLTYLFYYLFPELGLAVDDVYQNVYYYGFSFLFLLIFLNRYLCSTYSDLCDNILNTVFAVLAGFFLNYFLTLAVQSALSLVLNDLTNPNSALVDEQLVTNTGIMVAVTVLLAPVVEETLFRGVVFGTLRKKSRLAAYLVSSLIFSFYHLWQYFLIGFDWTLLLYTLQYVPASLVFCWCYERGRNLWAPIFLHMFINLMSVIVTIGLAS